MRTKPKKQRKAAADADTVADAVVDEVYNSVPHSFVFSRGVVGKNVEALISELRKLLQPYTASHLKAQRKNSLKDFVNVAGPLGVTHFIILSKTDRSVNLKLARLPRGPTISFQVQQYCLQKDVLSALKRHCMHDEQFHLPPLLVLNNFRHEGMHTKLMASMFQNMFPSINVHKVKLNMIKRCVLFDYNPDTTTIELRHYNIRVVPAGVSRGLSKLLQKRFPNMGRLEDISELLLTGVNLSESEAEQDGEHNITVLPQHVAGRGNTCSEQSAIRLTEIGPRMQLKLVKIQEGLCDGATLYHSFVQRTEDEVKTLRKKREEKRQLREQRKQHQEANVQRKQAERKAHKLHSLAGMIRKKKTVNKAKSNEKESSADEEDQDAEYYRQEVGVDPDPDLFPRRKRKQPHSVAPGPLSKRSRRKGTPKKSSKY